MTFSIQLSSDQVNEIVCQELSRLIKQELDRKKDGKYYDEDLVSVAMKLIRHYLSPSEYNMLLDVLDDYVAKK